MASQQDQLRAVEVMKAHSAALTSTLDRLHRAEQELRAARASFAKLTKAVAPTAPISDWIGGRTITLDAPAYIEHVTTRIDLFLAPLPTEPEATDG